MSEVLATYQLTKAYGSLRAVSDLNLSVEEGAVYGLLGPNGSGKTSTLGMLLGITNPTAGHYTWFGEEPTPAVRQQIGAVLEAPHFYPFLTAYQNLRIVCQIKQVPESRIPEVMAFVNLKGKANWRLRTFSTGMKQRLAIASALLNDPQVLVLDEPTNGLDPQGIAEVRDLINTIADNQRTIILASHLLDEVEKVCSHVAVMQQGQLLQSGKVADLLSDQPRVELSAPDLTLLRQNLDKLSAVQQVDFENNHVVATVDAGVSPGQLNQQLYEQGIVVDHLAMRPQNLEEQFLSLTQSSAS